MKYIQRQRRASENMKVKIGKKKKQRLLFKMFF